MKIEMPIKKTEHIVALEESTVKHCLDSQPYRSLVFARRSPQGTPLFLVAGVDQDPCSAENALRSAFKKHGGRCFYCKEPLSDDKPMTIDHVEGRKGASASSILNLVLACQPCNSRKANRPIELFMPEAAREWLSALIAQLECRLERL